MKLLSNGDKPRINIETIAKDKMFAMAKECKHKECAAMGIVEHQKNSNVYTIVDFILYPQLVTSVTVTNDDDAYIKWLMNLDPDVANNLRCQIHSHVSMAVTPSSVDWKTWDELYKATPEFLITIIVNNKEDFNVFLFSREDNILYEKSDLDIRFTNNGVDMIDWYKKAEADYIKYKEPASYINQNTTNTNVNTKKKRGRPPKNKTEELHPLDDDEDTLFIGAVCPICGSKHTEVMSVKGCYRECCECGNVFYDHTLKWG